jgi:hypothetical protein
MVIGVNLSPPNTLTETDEPSEFAGAPRWLWLLTLAATWALIITVSVGLVLTLFGQYRTWIVLLAAAFGVAGTWKFVCALAPTQRPTTEDEAKQWRTAGAWAIVAVLGIAVLGAYSMTRLGQHVLIQRDPGAYANAAKWLADTGSLEVDANSDLLSSVPGLVYSSPALYVVDDGQLEFQFSHGPDVAMAVAYDVAGRRGLFAASAAIGMLALLAMYLALSRVVGSGAIATAGTLGFGASVPFLYVTRNTYSEPFALLVMTLAVALLLSRAGPTRLRTIAVGICLGATLMFRVDGLLNVLGLIAIGVVLAIGGVRRRDLLYGAIAAAVPATIGWIDLKRLAGSYASGQVPQLRLMVVAGVIGIAIGCAATLRLKVFERIRFGIVKASATYAAVGVSTVLAVSWIVRPLIHEDQATWEAESPLFNAVQNLQTQNGLPQDGLRSYSEHTVEMVGWYYGIGVVALGIVGFGLVVRRGLLDLNSRWAPLCALWMVTVPLYLIDSRITPDQPWASRRFIPVVFPAFLICAAVAAAASTARIKRRHPSVGQRLRPSVLAGAAIVVFAVPSFVATWPVRNLADQRGYAGSLDTLCDRAGPGATIFGVGIRDFSMPVRSWCGLEAASIGQEPAADVTSALVSSAQARCEPLALVAFGASALEPYAASLVRIDVFGVINNQYPARTLDRPSDHYETQSLQYSIGRVALPPDCPPT